MAYASSACPDTLSWRTVEEVKPLRDAAGQIDIQGTMQAVTAVIEGWTREYPDQWLWVHAVAITAHVDPMGWRWSGVS